MSTPKDKAQPSPPQPGTLPPEEVVRRVLSNPKRLLHHLVVGEALAERPRRRR